MSKHLNILFITNDPSELDQFLLISENFDWNIVSAFDSFKAIQKIKENHDYDALIINHAIAPLDPIQLTDYLSIELNLDIPAILITENNTPKSLNNEAHFYVLKKPLTKKDIDLMFFFISESLGTSNKDIKPYSLNYLKQLSDNDPVFILESLQIFKDSVNEKINELKQVVKDAEFKEAREIAHNIKPSFEILENDYCRVICDKICYETEDQEISFLAEKLNQEYTKIVKELKKEFPEIK
ncbi:Hpt domain-containing protein [Joostella sp.]|uniref:Hpt domain-containing protein n=1 Tax=Joostella sp. TaxID=2231138 RepID=UPI003A934312